MREGEFVEMVDVCYAEVEGGGEDEGSWGWGRGDEYVERK